MDLDAFGISTQVLRAKVDRALAGAPLRLSLRSKGIELGRSSAPKQTDTTQRWKVELSVGDRGQPLHTKVEFSRRRTRGKTVLEVVDRQLLAEYQLLPLLAPHYGRDEAMQQKVAALVGRVAVQARDVFDLSLLVSGADDVARILAPVRKELPAAIERAMSVSYDEFRSQVVAYLAPSAVEQYRSREAWDALQGFIVSTLEEAAR
jgi:hypothetical protein